MSKELHVNVSRYLILFEYLFYLNQDKLLIPLAGCSIYAHKKDLLFYDMLDLELFVLLYYSNFFSLYIFHFLLTTGIRIVHRSKFRRQPEHCFDGTHCIGGRWGGYMYNHRVINSFTCFYHDKNSRKCIWNWKLWHNIYFLSL